MDLSIIASFKEIPLLYAFVIGLVTAIGPCPLSANIAAIAYVSSKFTDARGTVSAGIMYTAGRALTYTILGLLAYMFSSAILDSAPLLQDYDKVILGPLLLVVGLVMLELIKPNISVGDGLKAKYGLKLSNMGALGAFGLGAIFALAFCPYTAVMFFGLLIPLTLSSSVLGISYPLLFGIGTGLPVLVFALFLGISSSFAKAYVSKVVKAEPYVRKALGIGFILYGGYLLLAYAATIFGF
jgi:cytochrome c biogenesis protein CcdA